MDSVSFSESRLKMLTECLSSSIESYKEYARIGAILDDKAQKTVALGALFIGAALAFSKKENIAELTGIAGRSSMILVIMGGLLFLSSLILCLRLLWVRNSKLPLPPREIYDEVISILNRSEEDNRDRRENRIHQQIRAWIAAAEDQEKRNRTKARLLSGAHLCALSGMISLLILIVKLLYKL